MVLLVQGGHDRRDFGGSGSRGRAACLLGSGADYDAGGSLGGIDCVVGLGGISSAICLIGAGCDDAGGIDGTACLLGGGAAVVIRGSACVGGCSCTSCHLSHSPSN